MTKTKQMEKIMHGYWIYHPDWQADGECGYECSECERGVDVNYTYCPHCGVKMDRAMRIMRQRVKNPLPKIKKVLDKPENLCYNKDTNKRKRGKQNDTE